MIDFPSRFAVVVPAAGVGKRMQANHPKQYLTLHGKTILEHTVEHLLAHPAIELVVIAVSDGDEYYPELPLAKAENVVRVAGGKERVDSVLSGLQYLSQHYAHQYPWVLVHDAARPCVHQADIEQLIEQCQTTNQGGILAAPVRDTMKRTHQDNGHVVIDHTVEREHLWHALTPQMFPLINLKSALEEGLAHNKAITDEASAMEAIGYSPLIVQGRSDNIKVTQPEDLALAEFFLSQSY
ncbi:2-C-methyl-D-erythritol 4-phosphate cytidylyltransferase [Vibrio aphrogenes]|uniref:2-C-methyl-D-erythritol 4-phosphate cytidylyltransferase n=1 Tax=Vibrio aphrogenes TaxID=1891186 RepID=UPI000B3628A8|nr:2-C-methyl-D-erythritol 4-phosphate cytidylyltransferase [Vibrio aphrogenes]